jgi:hypothetical protein
MDWRGLDIPYKNLYQPLGYLMADGRNEEILTIGDEDLVEEYEDKGTLNVVKMIRRIKGSKKWKGRLLYSCSENLSEAMYNIGESGKMLEQGNLEEARHLAGLGLDMIRESKSSAANTLRSQRHINMLKARFGSNGTDD